MARVVVPITTIAETGTADPTPVTGDATNDHYIEDGDILLRLKNTSAGTLVATIVTSYATSGGIALADNEVSCTAGQTKFVKLKGTAVRTFYRQSGDSNRIYVDVTSNSWELTAFGI